MRRALWMIVPAVLLLAGCGNDRYLLRSKFVMSSQAEQPPEVIETPAYRTESPAVVTVAVRAPDSCSNRTADERTGGAQSQESVLKTTCGVEMAEIERALTKASYRVISWKVLSREMDGRNLSALEVAGKLGAEVLFQINSLEKSKKTLGKDARWERNYFESNAYGEVEQEQAFDEGTRAFFKRAFLDSYENAADFRRLAVTLDANAVMVKTGESVWFYRWTHADPTGFDYQRSVLVECDKPRICWAVRPRQRNPQAQRDVMSAGDSDAVSVAERPEDKDRAMYATLLADAIESLVAKFSKHRGRQTSFIDPNAAQPVVSTQPIAEPVKLTPVQ